MGKTKETLKNLRPVRYAYYRFCGIVKKNQLRANALKVLQEFNIDIPDSGEKDELVNDMVYMYSHYGYTPEEYLYFNFRNKNMDERLSFVADWEHLGYTCAMNDFRNAEIFDNKWKTYNTFKKYYGREVLQCKGGSDKERFIRFVDAHNRFIVKPLDLSAGKGIRIIDVSTLDVGVHDLYDSFIKAYNNIFVVEELILPDRSLEKLHPQSVNTIRVPAVRTDDDVILLHPFLRVCQHGNCVDNAGAGGIMCSIDVETGRILAAADKKGHRFEVHPDTGEKLVGFVVPRWDEAKEMVRELAAVVPSNRYTGWDITLTENGWIMIEANRRGQFGGIQTPLQIGFRKELNDVMAMIGKKY